MRICQEYVRPIGLYTLLIVSSIVALISSETNSAGEYKGKVDQPLPADTFASRFHTHSILRDKKDLRDLFVVQVGVSRRDGSGELVWVRGE